jgi:2-hydroxy-3-oxopropionate reductase
MTEATRVAFIGLGIMGAPMARNLKSAGFDVVGFNRGATRREAFARAGGTTSDSIHEAVCDADVVITMLSDSPDVASVIRREQGVFASARDGALLIDMSTIDPQVARDLHAEASSRGMGFLDAPVSGGEQGAIDGVLSVMVGGTDSDFQSGAAVFAGVGKTIVHVGPPGSGQTVKAANQLLVAGNLQLLAEAMVFLAKQGVSSAPAIEVLGGGLAGSTIIDRKSRGMLDRNFDPGFRVELHYKDLGIFMAAARAAQSATPLGSLVAQLMGSLRAQGLGDRDHSALLLQVEALSGWGFGGVGTHDDKRPRLGR